MQYDINIVVFHFLFIALATV